MSRGLAVFLVFWMGSSAVGADELHKCVDAAGAVSYQSAPCAAGSRTLWVRAVVPEATPARPAASAAPTVSPGPARPGARRTTAPRRDPAASRCAAARRSADATRERLWNRLTFRQRSELDAKVARACAG
ncbi:hypothetical protein [Arenimonas terrae]|uniref:DUF4124 domain-containing protein n=1 Tax=Arenimonas terrae TaxID=2546226 RepID=A0A5C4RTI7_9GAMM|nr:hypothetical protein [Arenimonas terrae]TNJ33917.1 hypothetical protein E1B00_11355 [Arenimonas terrae]